MWTRADWLEKHRKAYEKRSPAAQAFCPLPDGWKHMEQRELAAHLQKQIARCDLQGVYSSAVDQARGKNWTANWTVHVPQIQQALSIDLELRPHAGPGQRPAGYPVDHRLLAGRAAHLDRSAGQLKLTAEQHWNGKMEGHLHQVEVDVWMQSAKYSLAKMRSALENLCGYWDKLTPGVDCDCAVCGPCKRHLGRADATMTYIRSIMLHPLFALPPLPVAPPSPSEPLELQHLRERHRHWHQIYAEGLDHRATVGDAQELARVDETLAYARRKVHSFAKQIDDHVLRNALPR